EGERVGEGLLVFDDQHAGHVVPPCSAVELSTCDGCAMDFLLRGNGTCAPLTLDSKCAGMRRVKVEPVPGRLHSFTSPPWFAATCLTMASPRPVPPVARERALSTR